MIPALASDWLIPTLLCSTDQAGDQVNNFDLDFCSSQKVIWIQLPFLPVRSNPFWFINAADYLMVTSSVMVLWVLAMV